MFGILNRDDSSGAYYQHICTRPWPPEQASQSSWALDETRKTNTWWSQVLSLHNHSRRVLLQSGRTTRKSESPFVNNLAKLRLRKPSRSRIKFLPQQVLKEIWCSYYAWRITTINANLHSNRNCCDIAPHKHLVKYPLLVGFEIREHAICTRWLY